MDYVQSGSKGAETSDSHQAMILPVCSICNNVPLQGIKGVIRVGRAWICRSCEQEIMHLEVGSPAYGEMVEKIRRVWK